MAVQTNISSVSRRTLRRLAGVLVLGGLALAALPAAGEAQQASPTGSVAGRVLDERGAPVAGAQVSIDRVRGTLTRPDGRYVLERVPVGTHAVAVSMLGYVGENASATVAAGERTDQDFSLATDALKLQAVVVTGTQVPRTNLDASAAVTTLSPAEIAAAAPRSTTEMLRYIPGFTRVESSGGEVNQNIRMRGILREHFVMFLEDGLPVFPTMHSFFMNADNLFRPDENIERLEVVRGGSSALFGSNTPGAVVNFINRTGGADLAGTMKATVGTRGLARTDMVVNGPLGDDWRFNVGGFYRHDNGVRDPGFPGVRGGQLKGSVTRLLGNGYVRASVKAIDDRNQFLLPLPFQNPARPEYVPGFSKYGSASTPEGLRLRVPTPDGSIEYPLDDGIRTRATWLTGDANFVLGDGWSVRNSAQYMQNDQSWNAILPDHVMPAAEFAKDQIRAFGLPENTQYRYRYTNHFDAFNRPVSFEDATPNGLVFRGQQWNVQKPMSAFQNQLQVQKAVGKHNLSAGVYFAHYTQTNRFHWSHTLMDVRDQPRFLDLTLVDGANEIAVTRNGFRNYMVRYENGAGHATVVSGMLGGSAQVTDRLRVDVGARYEWNDFVQRSEVAGNVDLDGDAATRYDNMKWGTGAFRHFARTMGDVAGSVGLNYRVSDETSLYTLGSRAHKMPALDEFLAVGSQARADLFKAAEVRSFEGGVKHVTTRYGVTVNGFVTELLDVISQGATVDATGASRWLVRKAPDTRSIGAEVEFKARPIQSLDILASGTVMKATWLDCPEDSLNPGQDTCPGEAAPGTWIDLAPPVIGNVLATYELPFGGHVTADWRYVHRRYSAPPVLRDGQLVRNELPSYGYMNFGVNQPLPIQGMSLSGNVLNAFMSQGLEEGNPRLADVGGMVGEVYFMARPILPRRFIFALRYDF